MTVNIQEAIKFYEDLARKPSEVLYPDSFLQFDNLRLQFENQFVHLFSEFVSVGVGPGWWEPLAKCFTLFDELEKANPNYQIRITQVKEKFGGLRVYYVVRTLVPLPTEEDAILDEIYRLMQEAVVLAQRECSERCEVCGEPGEIRNAADWVKTYCDKHSKE